MSDTDEPFSERWWNLVCAVQPLIASFLALCGVFLFLALVARLFVDVGSSSHFILQVNFILLAPLITISAYLVYGCRNR